ncbi:hypothetical protein Cgig2_007647 [Carnegiea gigantea]|uniref:Uncharacterized protein n=1 Tax=Carnegiea gigantea TaxID=171969 RepID=A0A9Q1GQH8_9CARY|nr:hypothetical protein Cgig2_007647 [Carnegiea gigantea]
MGKKPTTSKPSSLGVSKRAKMVASTSIINVPSIRAQATQGNRPTPPHVINKYELQFINQEHINHYNLVACRRITEPKYIYLGLWGSLGLLDSLNELLEVVGWVYDDNIKIEADEDAPLPNGGNANGGDEGAGSSGEHSTQDACAPHAPQALRDTLKINKSCSTSKWSLIAGSKAWSAMFTRPMSTMVSPNP